MLITSISYVGYGDAKVISDKFKNKANFEKFKEAIGEALIYVRDADKNLITDATNQNKGFLEISYKTSYHGSWYLSNCLDIWRNYPTATLPSSQFGNGVYTPR